MFRCGDGAYVAAGLHCDGARDCADGSDETAAACARASCSAQLFRCGYGACVDRGALCNQVTLTHLLFICFIIKKERQRVIISIIKHYF